MNTLTTVLFLLDILSLKENYKRVLNKIQVKKIEKLINIFYSETNNSNPIQEGEYLELYKIYTSKNPSDENKVIKEAIKQTVNNIKNFLETGNIVEQIENESNNKIITSLNKAYSFITTTLKDQINEIVNTPLSNNELEQLKIDSSHNAHIGIVKAYLSSNRSKRVFCKRNFITEKRVDKAISYVLSSTDESIKDLKDQLLLQQKTIEEELELVEQVIVNYNRRQRNISLLEFQSLTHLTINEALKELKDRNSCAYPQIYELYREYQNKYRLKDISFDSIRRMKTIVNGKELTDYDHDIIEEFIVANRYPEQQAIYAYVRDAYLNGNLESIKRETLKETVLNKFNLSEKPKEKTLK